MSARTGMANLIKRLRGLTQAGTADYSIAGYTYWADADLQDRLDARCTLIEGAALTWLMDSVGAGKQEYHRLKSPYRDLEEAESGTIHWAVRDNQGNEAGTAAYTKDYTRGELRFSADQSGTASYRLWARSYDLYGAAADVWREKSAYYSDWYNYSSEGQRFDRQKAFDQALQMADQMARKAGANKAAGELHSSLFVRTDLNPRSR
jgi:hypothetical protein